MINSIHQSAIFDQLEEVFLTLTQEEEDEAGSAPTPEEPTAIDAEAEPEAAEAPETLAADARGETPAAEAEATPKAEEATGEPLGGDAETPTAEAAEAAQTVDAEEESSILPRSE